MGNEPQQSRKSTSACRLMKIVNRREFVAAVAGAVVAPSAMRRTAQTFSLEAGTATIDITPDRSLWMAGFALRKQASQGVALPLHAKALALKPSSGACRGAGHRRSPWCDSRASPIGWRRRSSGGTALPARTSCSMRATRTAARSSTSSCRSRMTSRPTSGTRFAPTRPDSRTN